MEIIINNNQTKEKWTLELEQVIIKVIGSIAEAKGLGVEAEVGITLVDDEEITTLNHEYRGINSPTDVLSFALNDTTVSDVVDAPAEQAVMLGDIVISLERAVCQAEEYGHSLFREVSFLTAHGFLHLLGYDHQTASQEEIMTQMTEKILADIGMAR